MKVVGKTRKNPNRLPVRTSAWSIGDSNPWPRQCECRALPTALMPHIHQPAWSTDVLPYADMHGWISTTLYSIAYLSEICKTFFIDGYLWEGTTVRLYGNPVMPGASCPSIPPGAQKSREKVKKRLTDMRGCAIIHCCQRITVSCKADVHALGGSWFAACACSSVG